MHAPDTPSAFDHPALAKCISLWLLVLRAARNATPLPSPTQPPSAFVHELKEASDGRRLTAQQCTSIPSSCWLSMNQAMCRSPQSARNCCSRSSPSATSAGPLVTSNLPFEDWTSVLGSERLIGALRDRLTHHVHILELNGENFRLATNKTVQRRDP